MPETKHVLEHLRVENFKTSAKFRSTRRGGSSIGLPNRNREDHGRSLLAQYQDIVQAAEQLPGYNPSVAEGPLGFYVELESTPGYDIYDSLGRKMGKAENHILPAVIKYDEKSNTDRATVFIPLRKRDTYAKKIDKYLNEDTKKGFPKEQNFAASIQNMRLGQVQSLWTDRRALPAPNETVWWEVWTWAYRVESILNVAQKLGLRISENRLRFPETHVLPIYADIDGMARLLVNSGGAVMELRYASDNPQFYMDLNLLEQEDWIRDMLGRVTPSSVHAPHICILDTGVNASHPLLTGSLAIEECYSHHPDWRTHDHHGHGTVMAGCSLFGDLTFHLAGTFPIQLNHRLESVKILPPSTFGENDPDWYGFITQGAVALPEIDYPDRNRVFCMAVTSGVNDASRPTTWSSAIDQICAATDVDELHFKRLFMVSAGNVRWDYSNYPSINDNSPIEDPAQAWNAITVGAYTDKVTITEPDYQHYTPVAESGDLSPYSRTSLLWPKRTPLKPEVVFEGGNLGQGGAEPEALHSLSLLSTGAQRPFSTINATSAATAQAARFAATLWAEYPNFWPETVRGLMIHSAEWTEKMHAFIKERSGTLEHPLVIRRFGYGVPNIERALKSAANDISLIAEAEIQPFIEKDRKVSFNEVHYYNLPWPREVLEQISEDVQMRVTLSYFIEPAPESATVKDPYSYSSFGLRFLVKAPDETDSDFKKRINDWERENRQGSGTSHDPRWFLGPTGISAGSVYSDIWEGPGADLANCGMIAVYPVGGWWRSRKALGCVNKKARYSLIISITSPKLNIDLYTPIKTQIDVSTEIRT